MKVNWKEHLYDIASFGGLAFCILVFTILSSGRMWSTYNMGILIEAACVYTIMAIGAVFIYAMGYMDISVGAQIGVYSILIIKLVNQTGSLWIGFLVVLFIALVCGTVNGAVAVFLRLPSIVTSIFLSFIFTGFQILMMEKSGMNTIAADYDFSFLKHPAVMLGTIVIVLAGAVYLFRFSRLGFYVRCIGANETAAKQAGVDTTCWKVLAYLFFGFCVSVGAVFLTARTGSAGKGTGNGYAMDVMVALILGGMPLSGGMKSRISSAVIGTFTYCILSNGLTLSGIDTSYINFMKGVIFLAVILITCRKKTGILPK